MAHHAGKLENCRDLIIVLELFKKAEYPISAQYIAQNGYDFAASGKVMLNISEKIGQMRAPINADRGYTVSYSACWKKADPHTTPGVRVNRDNSITFFLDELTQPWHDGQKRYWLIAAPGWSPRWIITNEGLLVPCTAGYRHDRPAPATPPKPQPAAAPPDPEPVQSEPHQCINPACPKTFTGVLPWCCDDCRTAFRRSLVAPSAPGTGYRNL